MAVLYISETELARNTASLLDRVQAGMEIVIERNHRPAAVLRAAGSRGRRLTEILASLSADSTATIDEDFAVEVHAAIDAHREPLDPPDWN